MPSQLDPLRDILHRVHISSAVFLRGEFSAPWAFQSCTADQLSQVLGLGGGQIVLFHIVREGTCQVTLDSGETVAAGAGEALVLPYSSLHRMGWPEDTPPAPIETLIPPPPWSAMPVVRLGEGGPPTSILCGYLQCAEMIFNPILSTLPGLIHVRPVAPELAGLLRAAGDFALSAPQGSDRVVGPAVSRLAESLLIECLRQYAETLPPEQTGLLSALRDPLIARAVSELHADPARAWTVNDLARNVGSSRSVLARRFKELLHQSPMRYLANWRLQLAAQQLAHGAASVSEIAFAVGYQSEAAFSRAFKRRLGASPSDWRGGA